jgi:methanogenic corrinoid protein MtbC1
VTILMSLAGFAYLAFFADADHRVGLGLVLGVVAVSGLLAQFVVPWRRIVASPLRPNGRPTGSGSPPLPARGGASTTSTAPLTPRSTSASWWGRGGRSRPRLSPDRYRRSLNRVTEKSAGADNSTGQVTERDTARISRLFLEALRAADDPGAYRIASGAMGAGLTTPALYQRVIVPAMHEIGLLWERGAITVADEHLATALTNRVLAALRPAPAEPTAPRVGQALLATVEGERHALGLRMAADLLEDAGYETLYLGADVPTDALLRAVESFSPDLLALAATMPDLTSRMEEIAAEVRRAHPGLGLLIGGQGAPPRIEGGTLVQDLELVPERVPALIEPETAA